MLSFFILCSLVDFFIYCKEIILLLKFKIEMLFQSINYVFILLIVTYFF